MGDVEELTFLITNSVWKIDSYYDVSQSVTFCTVLSLFFSPSVFKVREKTLILTIIENLSKYLYEKMH